MVQTDTVPAKQSTVSERLPFSDCLFGIIDPISLGVDNEPNIAIAMEKVAAHMRANGIESATVLLPGSHKKANRFFADLVKLKERNSEIYATVTNMHYMVHGHSKNHEGIVVLKSVEIRQIFN